MFVFLKWLSFLPISLLGILAAWLVAPICPLCVDRETWRLPPWLAWASTPHTDLRGDRKHRARFGDKNSYFQLFWWVIRNPAVVFQRNVLGVVVKVTDDFIVWGDINARKHGGWWFTILKRKGLTIGFQAFCEIPYKWKPGKGFRVCIGWKMWDGIPSEEPCQYVNRITIYKSLDFK